MISTNFTITDRIISSCDKDITMTAGDTLAFGVEIVDQDGEPMNADSITFIAKANYSSLYPDLFNKTIGDGITHEGTGLYAVRVDPTDTVSASGRVFYALRIGVGDDVFTAMKGTLDIQRKVHEYSA